MPLRVTQYGEPILRKKGAPIRQFDSGLKSIADQMVETMYAEAGIGLAAQQIGRAIQLCVIDVRIEGTPPPFSYELDGKSPPLDLIMPMTLVNPDVTPASEFVEEQEEGCLSFPEIRGIVPRNSQIHVDYQDPDGNKHQLTCDGLFARVILHEVDHLHGILFIDRMSTRDLRKIEDPLKRLKRSTREWLKHNSGDAPPL